MLVSESGEGKSTLALQLAASFITGIPFPDGSAYSGERGCVLWCEAESSQMLNVERADRLGIPRDRIYTPLREGWEEVSLNNPVHLSAIRMATMRDDVKLVIVDSLSGANSRDENTAGMVHVVKSLAQLARDSGKAVLLLHHLGKPPLDAGGRNLLHRIRGSSGIIQPARSILAIDSPVSADPAYRRLSVLKMSLGRTPEPLGFRITDNGIIFGPPPVIESARTRHHELRQWLTDRLKDGPVSAKQLEEELEEHGFSVDVAKRVKNELGISSTKKAGGWIWKMQ